MSAQELSVELDELTRKVHDIEHNLHVLPNRVETPEEMHLREELIDLTMRIDEIKQKMNKDIEVEY